MSVNIPHLQQGPTQIFPQHWAMFDYLGLQPFRNYKLKPKWSIGTQGKQLVRKKVNFCVTIDILLTPTARVWDEGGKTPQIFRWCDKQETKPITAFWGSQSNHKDTKENLKKDIKTYIQRRLLLTSISPPNYLHDIVIYMIFVVTGQK